MTSSEKKFHKIFNINEQLIKQISCSLVNFSFGVLYITKNNLCFNSVFLKKNISIPFNEILSMKISKDSKKIIITTIVKIYRQSNLIFSNFSNLKETFNLLDKAFQKTKNIFSHREIYSNYLTENNLSKQNTTLSLNSSILNYSISDLNLNEETNNEIEFIDLKKNSTLICIKQINLSSKDFFEKFFYPKNEKEDFSYPKFYESLNDHFNITESNFKDVISENKELIIKEREITFNLKLKNIPFVNESKVISKQKLIINKNTNFYIIETTSQSQGVPFSNSFQIIDQYEIYPLNNNNCIIRASAYPFFLEETFFKKIIENTAQKTFFENNQNWLNYIQKKGFIIKEFDNNDNIKKKKHNNENILII